MLYDPLDNAWPIVLQDVLNWAHPANQGVVGHWLTLPGWEGGKFWWDLTGKSPGTLTSMASTAGWRSTSRQGGYGHMLGDGTGKVVVAAAPSLTLTGDMSAFMWYRGTAIQDALIQFYNSGSPFTGWGFQTGQAGGGAGCPSVWSNAAGTWVGSSTAVNDGNFHYIGFIRSGSTITYMIDRKTAGNSTSAAPGSWTGNKQFGIWTGASVDDIVIYNRAVSVAEAQARYDLSRWGYPGLINRFDPTTGTAAKTFAYWDWWVSAQLAGGLHTMGLSA